MFDAKNFEEFLSIVFDRAVMKGELKEMMAYSLLAGGKRFRPRLLIDTFSDFAKRRETDVDESAVYVFAVAIECIHTYSLIHDDLPCMDDDDLRRGRATSHKVFGEANALLAGDALLNLAYELMAGASACRAHVAAMQYISRCAGGSGMVLGQVMDVANEGSNVDLPTLTQIYFLKTSALIRASVVGGVLLAGGTEREIRLAEELGDKLGLLFQITDDVIDRQSSSDEAGKTTGSDEIKTTYPSLMGAEELEKLLLELVDEIECVIEELGLISLREVVKNLVGRKR